MSSKDQGNLGKDIQAILLRQQQQAAEQKGISKEMQALRERIKGGETTGDWKQDISLVLGAGINHEQIREGLNKLESSVASHQGEAIMLCDYTHRPGGHLDSGCVRGLQRDFTNVMIQIGFLEGEVGVSRNPLALTLPVGNHIVFSGGGESFGIFMWKLKKLLARVPKQGNIEFFENSILSLVARVMGLQPEPSLLWSNLSSRRSLIDDSRFSFQGIYGGHHRMDSSTELHTISIGNEEVLGFLNDPQKIWATPNLLVVAAGKLHGLLPNTLEVRKAAAFIRGKLEQEIEEANQALAKLDTQIEAAKTTIQTARRSKAEVQHKVEDIGRQITELGLDKFLVEEAVGEVDFAISD